MSKPAAHLLRASLVVVGLSSFAHAEVTVHETVVHDTTTVVDLTLDDDTVRCSAADYGSSFLKVLIPELAQLTLLDHQNTGAGAPCVAAGPCEPGHTPYDVIVPGHPIEPVAVNVRAVRVDAIDAAAHTCTTSLTERVAVTIRGIPFAHERQASLGSRPYDDCVAAAPREQAPASPGVAIDDAAAAAIDDSSAAGCNAGAGGGQLGLALGLALVTLRRRR